MNQVEWSMCVDRLCENWKRYAEQFSNVRWQNRFGHLKKDTMLKAIDDYADDNLQAPTVNALAAYLPRGSQVNKPDPGHVHLWERCLDAIMCNLCGKHGEGCHCPTCSCPHEAVHFDGWHASGIGWMRCETCISTWLNPRMHMPEDVRYEWETIHAPNNDIPF